MIDKARLSYDGLVELLGVPVPVPVSIEDARARWGSLVTAGANGRTVVITRERWEWAGLVPLSKVGGVRTGLPLVPVSIARRKLGELCPSGR
ncbi:hypothetical protein FAF44_33115 [Nonomuraea sp. MG754425]|uniref:hypothetical protein n=1 Tax=Nonomuraea sp. MG754425 TaxID=2570319 RepID=UPI001F20056F|nr:hypothetical protein [Nonomuraea sp. MG754425]MCF6473192.1 hypothetical protein [Nonomuraea sp. MG754425]